MYVSMYLYMYVCVCKYVSMCIYCLKLVQTDGYICIDFVYIERKKNSI